MKPSMVDTDILSLFLRGDSKVTARFAEYLAEHQKINLSIITYYEIASGLKHRDARKQLKVFLDFLEHNVVLPLSIESVNLSSDPTPCHANMDDPLTTSTCSSRASHWPINWCS